MNSRLFQIYLCRAVRFQQTLEQLLFAETRSFEATALTSPESLPPLAPPEGIYRPIGENESWGKLWDSGYFKLRGEIPEEWSGRPVWLKLIMGGEILLYDADYTAIGHLTDSSVQVRNFKKELFPVCNSAVPGEMVFFAEVAANGFHMTADIPVGVCQDLKYGCFRKEVWDLLNDFRTVLGMLEIHQKPPYAIPGGYHWDPRTAAGPADRRAARLCTVLNEAVNVFAEDPDHAAAARRVLRPELERPAQSSVLSTTAVGHAHLDIGYLWKIRETQRKACRTFAGQLFNIRTYPEYVFGMSQPQIYRYVRERMPQLFDQVREMVRAGRWELQGGMWVEADCVLPSGESLIRQFLHGKNFWRDEFGEDVKNAWLPDAFGFSAALPQIMRQCGCDFLLSQKLSWNEFNRFPHHSFRWRGFGGSEVLGHFPPEDNYNAYLEPSALHFAENNFQENHLMDEFMTLFGAGDGGGGPKMEHIESGIRNADLEDVPHLKFGRSCDFFERMEKLRDRLPCHEGELYFELHRGTLTNQGRIKRYHRRIEQRLAAVEVLLASAPPEAWPRKEWDRLWKEALLFQFHDIVTGTSIFEVHREVMERYRTLDAELTKLADDCAAEFGSPDRDALTLFQTMNSAYRRLIRLPDSWLDCRVTDAEGTEVPVQRDSRGMTAQLPLGPLACVRLRREAGRATPSARPAESPVLENDCVRCEFAADGTLKRLFDKRLNRDMLGKDGGNLLRLYVDTPRIFEGCEVEITDLDIEPARPEVRQEPETEAGPLRGMIHFHLQIGKSRIEQTAILEAGSSCLDFETRVEWAESRRRLWVGFSVDSDAEEVTCETAHGFLRRPLHCNTSRELAQFEFPAQRYVDWSDDRGGVALLNNGRYGYSTAGGKLGLSLLRSPTMEDRSCDNGTHLFTYAVYSHPGDFRESGVLAEAEALNREPLCLEGVAGVPMPPFRLVGDGVRLEAFKRAERGDDLIVRLVESRGRHSAVHLEAPGLEVRNCDPLEWREGEIPPAESDGGILLDFRPFEVRTLRLRK